MTLHDDRPTIAPEELAKFVGEVFTIVPFPKVEGIKVRSNLPQLDADLLSDVVYWAYLESQAKARSKKASKARALLKERFSGWGHWYQSSWARGLPRNYRVTENHRPVAREQIKCSSAFCIAGQVVVQKGWVMLSNENGGADSCVPPSAVTRDRRHVQRADESKMASISAVAQQELGLREFEANTLFSAGNSIGMVVTMACYFARRRGQDLYLPEEVLVYDRKWKDESSIFTRALSGH